MPAPSSSGQRPRWPNHGQAEEWRRALEDASPPEPTPLGRLLASGIRALKEDGDLSTARGYFVRAAILANDTSNNDDLVHAVLGWSGIWVHESRGVVDSARMSAWRAKAVDRVDPASTLGLRLAARIAAEDDYTAGTTHRVLAALTRAREDGDPILLGETLNLAHHCMLGPEHATSRAALADELLALGATKGRRVDILLGLLWRTVDSFLEGHPQAQRCLEELRQCLQQRDFLAISYVVAALDVMLAIRGGKLELAETLAASCYELGERVGDADALSWYGAHLCAIRWYQGRSEEMAALLVSMVAEPTLSTTNEAFCAALAVSSAAAGLHDQAALALARLRGPSLTNLRSSSTWMAALLGACEAAHALGDTAAAAEAYELLAPFAERPVMASLAIACFGSTHYPLALAALAQGRTDLAISHLEHAVRANEALGNLPAAQMARSRLDSIPRPGPGVGPTMRILRTGADWEVTYGWRTAIVSDCLGMRYLATLVGQPGRHFHAADLAGHPTAEASNQPLLDRRAAANYRARLTQLREIIDDPTPAQRSETTDDARREYDLILRELAKATGLHGRARQFSNVDERARTSVQKAIRRALSRLRVLEPALADEIERRLITGYTCCFQT